MRSDWSESVNGDEEEPEYPYRDPASIQRANSIGYLDADALKRKAEIDEHVANYVSGQMEKVLKGESSTADADELETQADNSNEQNGGGFRLKIWGP
jgi:hypothetical protein